MSADPSLAHRTDLRSDEYSGQVRCFSDYFWPPPLRLVKVTVDRAKITLLHPEACLYTYTVGISAPAYQRCACNPDLLCNMHYSGAAFAGNRSFAQDITVLSVLGVTCPGLVCFFFLHEICLFLSTKNALKGSR